jgi:hypothetical protein|tara:strand:- start:17 stop:481 length:465 start_codon:yes stop_codon:yes gene_type:complete
VRDLIEEWVESDLNVVDPDAGFAPCPFAKKALKDDKLKLVECNGDLWKKVAGECKNFDPKYSVIICFEDDPEESYDQIEVACMALNEWFSLNKMDVWVLAFQTDFTMVFVQKLSELDDASQRLEKVGYYKNYNQEDYVNLILSRRQRRLSNARG